MGTLSPFVFPLFFTHLQVRYLFGFVFSVYRPSYCTKHLQNLAIDQDQYRDGKQALAWQGKGQRQRAEVQGWGWRRGSRQRGKEESI